MERIPVAGPWITEREIAYVTDAVKTAWYGEANAYQRRFEEAFKTYVSRRYAMALPSATSAIHLALAALGILGEHRAQVAAVDLIVMRLQGFPCGAIG